MATSEEGRCDWVGSQGADNVLIPHLEAADVGMFTGRKCTNYTYGLWTPLYVWCSYTHCTFKKNIRDYELPKK